MKIIHILNTNKFSGAENVAITIINQMKNDNNIVYVSPDGPIREYLEENNITFEPIKKICVSELRRVIKKYNPDIIHAHDFTASVISSIVCKKIKLISHIHNNAKWIKKLNLNSIMYLLSSFKYKKVLMVSDSIIKEYIFGKLISNKTIIIGNPININDIIKKSNEYVEEEMYDLIYLGRFSEEKNPIRFINIVKEIARKISINAVMVGEGNLKTQCEQLIHMLSLEKIIKIKEFKKNPYPLLKKAKILCMTSDWEGYGLVSVEALTLGKPVVATDAGGISNIVTSDCGIVINDIKCLIDETIKLIEDKNYYNQKSRNAISRSIEMNNIDEYISYLYKIYSE